MNKLQELFKDISINEKVFLISIALIILGLILPLTSPIGSFNALNSMEGAIFFFLIIGALGLFFWKKEYSEAALLVLSGLGIFQIIYTIISFGGFTIDLGFLGEISLFTFLGIGAYILTIGLIGSMIIAILLLKKQKNSVKLFVISLIVLLVICGLDIAYNKINLSDEGTRNNDIEDFWDVEDSDSEIQNDVTVTEEQKEEVICPTMSREGKFEFKLDQTSDYIWLYADFLTTAKFSDGWELSNKPDSSGYGRSTNSFSCKKGSVEGENINYLYCRPSLYYRPTLKKNTIDEEGNIVKTDYLYIRPFIFDAKGKDITNAEDLKSLPLEGMTCSESYY